MLASRLQDIPERGRVIALHGVDHGAAVALASAQVRSGYELRCLPHGFPAVDNRNDYTMLIDDFANAANFIASISPAGEIMNKVFSGLRL